MDDKECKHLFSRFFIDCSVRGTTYTHCTEVSTDSVWCDVTGVRTGAVCSPPNETSSFYKKLTTITTLTSLTTCLACVLENMWVVTECMPVKFRLSCPECG
eukprot:sb/3478467/